MLILICVKQVELDRTNCNACLQRKERHSLCSDASIPKHAFDHHELRVSLEVFEHSLHPYKACMTPCPTTTRAVQQTDLVAQLMQ